MGSSQVEVDVDFVSYGSRKGRDKSGAYLFLPDSEASSIVLSNGKPSIVMVIGPLVSMCDSAVMVTEWYTAAETSGFCMLDVQPLKSSAPFCV